MSDLSDFLLARIAEDERLLIGGDREPHAAHLSDVVGTMRPDICPTCAGITVSGYRRALAECEAKRRIMELHRPYYEGNDAVESDGLCAGCNGARHVDQCPNLAAIALPYAEHPDYRSEWAL